MGKKKQQRLKNLQHCQKSRKGKVGAKENVTEEITAMIKEPRIIMTKGVSAASQELDTSYTSQVQGAKRKLTWNTST